MKTTYPLTGGVTRFQVPWPYLSRQHVVTLINDTTPVAHTWVSDTEIEVLGPGGGPPLGSTLTVMRVTPDLPSYAEIKDAANLTADDLNRMRLQLLYLIQERSGGMAGAIGNAVNAISDPLSTIDSDIAQIQTALATLTAGLQTLNQLATDIGNAQSEAAQIRQDLLDAIGETDGRFDTLEQRTTLVESSVDNAHSRVSDETTARVGADAALATQITTLDARVTTEVSNLEASIETVEGAMVAGDSALAAQITTLQASVGDGDLLVSNAKFDPAGGKWRYSDGTAATMVPRTDSRLPAGCPGPYALLVDRDSYGLYNEPTTHYVTPGEALDLSFYAARIASGTAGLYVLARFYNDADAYVSDGVSALFTPPTGSWSRFAYSCTVPANARRVVLVFYRDPANGQAAICRPDLRRKPANVAAVETLASATASALDGVEANYTVKVQARSDGKKAIAGIGLNATAEGSTSQSEIVLMADRVVVVPGNNVNATLKPLLAIGAVNGSNTVVVNGDLLADGAVVARHVAAKSIGAEKLVVAPGAGGYVNSDPLLQNPNEWTSIGYASVAYSPTFAMASDWRAGLFASAGRQREIRSARFPVQAGKTYHAESGVWVYAGSPAPTWYFLVTFYDGAGNWIGPASSYPMGWPAQGSYYYYGLIGGTAPQGFSTYSITFGGGTPYAIPSWATTCEVGVLACYNDVATGWAYGGTRVREVQQSVTIQDGAVTAQKINVSQLSAITATIGTLRTATSGGRMEIADNVQRIYDSSNVLRVKIGNLAL